MAKRSLQTTQKDVANCDHLPQLSVESRILTIRDVQVILDRDLAELYGVQTARLNEQVKRNSRRFPEAFRFQLNQQETDELIANCDRFKTLKHSSFCPYAFTEQGVAMLSAVLHSDTAVDISIRIMNAFVAMRHFLLSNAQVFQRLDRMELKQLETDHKIEQIFDKLEEQSVIPKQNIFFDGQIFDAYVQIVSLIKQANHSIVLIDNYIDETTLTMLSKRDASVSATIYTRQLSNQQQLDIERHNQQYPPITVNLCQRNHDRFLIIDDVVYLFGASLKDAGKKLFAYIKMKDTPATELLNNIR